MSPLLCHWATPPGKACLNAREGILRFSIESHARDYETFVYRSSQCP
jgi:hypothetical protein